MTAEAQEVSRNRKLATYLIDVTDDSGAPVAHFRGTVYRKSVAVGDVLAPRPPARRYMCLEGLGNPHQATDDTPCESRQGLHEQGASRERADQA